MGAPQFTHSIAEGKGKQREKLQPTKRSMMSIPLFSLSLFSSLLLLYISMTMIREQMRVLEIKIAAAEKERGSMLKILQNSSTR